MPSQEGADRLAERAIRYFHERPSNFPIGRPYNCCESILLALKDYLGVKPDLIPRIGTGLGAGVSLNGLLCSAISSVVVAIGIKHGRVRPEDNPQPVWDIVDRYVTEFKDRFGYTDCRHLTGMNLKTEEGMKEYFAKVHDYTCVEN